jgi:hypothetical protein
MVREWPVRSAITVILPLLFAASLLANSYYHGVLFTYAGAFAAVFVGMAVLTTRQQLAAFRAAQLQSAYTNED